jgi:hypothetical protein
MTMNTPQAQSMPTPMPPGRTARFLLRHNGLLALLLGAVLVVLVAGIPRLQISWDDRGFFGNRNAEFARIRALEDLYSGAQSLLFMLVPPEGEAFTPDTLEVLRDITRAAWQIPYALRVDSPANHTQSRAEGDDILVEPLLPEEGAITPAMAETFREDTRRNPELLDSLVARDGGAFGIRVAIALPEDDRAARAETADYVAKAVAGWKAAHPGFDVRVTGALLGGMTMAQATRDDLVTLVPLATVVVFALLLAMVRSLVCAAVSGAVVVSGTLATLGLAGWLGIELTAGTAISPVSVMVLIAASCIHVSLSWIRRLPGAPPREAAAQSLAENLGPVVVTNLTTALGFLCLNFSDSPPLRDMGNIVAFGLLYGMAAVLLFLPLALARGPARPPRRQPIPPEMMRALAGRVIRHRRPLLVLFPLVTALSVVGVLRIGFDDSIFRYFDDRYAFRQDADAIQERLTGLESLQFSFTAPEGTNVFDPDFLRRVERFQDWLEAQPEVVASGAIVGILKRLNQALNRDDPAFHRLADSREANAQLMMFYELSLPVGRDLNGVIDINRRATLLTAVLRTDHAREVRGLAARADAWLAGNEPALEGRATGGSIAFARLSQRNNAQMLWGLGAVLLMVSGVMLFTLRSLRYGLISLVPNVLPALLAFGFWGFTVGDVNLGSTIVTTMTFGIVVDDTTHLLMHYLRRRRAGAGAEAALRETFAGVGPAIVITSLALMVGFAIMMLSGFAVNQHVGMLTLFVIGFALLADLFLLPPVLLALEGSSR